MEQVLKGIFDTLYLPMYLHGFAPVLHFLLPLAD